MTVPMKRVSSLLKRWYFLRMLSREDVPDRPDETDVIEGRLADLLRLTHDLEALLLSGRVKGSDHERQVRGAISGVRRETADLDDCSLEDEVEIVESILAELQIYIARSLCLSIVREYSDFLVPLVKHVECFVKTIAAKTVRVGIVVDFHVAWADGITDHTFWRANWSLIVEGVHQSLLDRSIFRSTA